MIRTLVAYLLLLPLLPLCACAVPVTASGPGLTAAIPDYPARYVAEQQALQAARTAILIALQVGKIDKAEAARQSKDLESNLGLAVMLGRTAHAGVADTPEMAAAAQQAAAARAALDAALK